MNTTQMTYDEWLKVTEQEPEIVTCNSCRGGGRQPCMNCNGSGKCECTCGHSHPCGVCRGTGEETCFVCGGAGDYDYTFTEYEKQKARDAQLLSKLNP